MWEKGREEGEEGGENVKRCWYRRADCEVLFRVRIWCQDALFMAFTRFAFALFSSQSSELVYSSLKRKLIVVWDWDFNCFHFQGKRGKRKESLDSFSPQPLLTLRGSQGINDPIVNKMNDIHTRRRRREYEDEKRRRRPFPCLGVWEQREKRRSLLKIRFHYSLFRLSCWFPFLHVCRFSLEKQITCSNEKTSGSVARKGFTLLSLRPPPVCFPVHMTTVSFSHSVPCLPDSFCPVLPHTFAMYTHTGHCVLTPKALELVIPSRCPVLQISCSQHELQRHQNTLTTWGKEYVCLTACVRLQKWSLLYLYSYSNRYPLILHHHQQHHHVSLSLSNPITLRGTTTSCLIPSCSSLLKYRSLC